MRIEEVDEPTDTHNPTPMDIDNVDEEEVKQEADLKDMGNGPEAQNEEEDDRDARKSKKKKKHKSEKKDRKEKKKSRKDKKKEEGSEEEAAPAEENEEKGGEAPASSPKAANGKGDHDSGEKKKREKDEERGWGAVNDDRRRRDYRRNDVQRRSRSRERSRGRDRSFRGYRGRGGGGGGGGYYNRRRSPTPPRRRDRREQDRDRRRDRSRSRERRRDRSRSRGRRRRSPSPSSSESSRSSDASTSRDRKKKSKKEEPVVEDPNAGLPTLQDIIKQNPGMGIVQALQKLEELKQTRAHEVHFKAVLESQAKMQANFQAAAAVAQAQAKAQAATITVGGGLGAAPLTSVAPNNPVIAAAAAAIPNAALTKPARELYVGNLPPGVQAPQLQEFLGAAIQQLKLNITPGNPILSTWLSADTHYAFCEFRTIEETNNALTLNGITVGNAQLKIGRPKTYTGPLPTTAAGLGSLGIGLGGLSLGSLGATTGATATGTTAAGVGSLATPSLGGLPGRPQSNYLMLVNIPTILGELDVKELLKPFGELRSFNMLKDKEGVSKGVCIFEFAERVQTDVALKGLAGLDIGDKKLHIQEIPPEQASMLLKPTATVVAAGGDDVGASQVIRLGNMLAENMDAEEVDEIKEDVADECRKHGNLVSVHMAVDQSYIFVEFGDCKAAKRARDSLAGRSFDGRTVVAEYYPLEAYKAADYTQELAEKAEATAEEKAEGEATSADAPAGEAYDIEEETKEEISPTEDNGQEKEAAPADVDDGDDFVPPAAAIGEDEDLD